MAKWKRVKRPKQYKNSASTKLVEIKRPVEYKKDIDHVCINDRCNKHFKGNAKAMWCPECRVNSARERKRMIANGTWDKA